METQADRLTLAALMADALGDGDAFALDDPERPSIRDRYSIRPTLDGRHMLERITA